MVLASGTNAFSKEMAIRKKIASIYNKRQDDFPSLRDYNDYLEEVEVMTVNLVDGIDVPSIEAKIVKYQQENAEQIINTRAIKAEELAAAMAASRGPVVMQNVTDGAMTQSAAQAGNAFTSQKQYAPTVPGGQPRPTGMAPQPLVIGGGSEMHGYAIDSEEMIRLRVERGGRAGGWTLEISKKRALEEAFACVWI